MYTRESRKELVDQVRYNYFEIADGNATLAYIKDDEWLYYGVSFCAPQDNFCKETGRSIARQRLFRGCGQKKVTLNGGRNYDPKLYALSLVYMADAPQWVKKLKGPRVQYRGKRNAQKPA